MLTKDRIDKHALQAVDCPPATWVVLRSAMHRLVDKESAAVAERDARIAELERQLAEARKDAERWNWLNWHIGVAWGEEGFTSLIRIVSEKHRALINTQVDKLMAGELPEAPAIRAAIKEQT